MGLGNQARYVFSVVEWESRRVGLLELGRGHALQIQDWIARNEGLRGMSIEIVRQSVKKQSGLEVTYVDEEAPVVFKFLEGPDVERAVRATWQAQASITLEGGPSPVREAVRSA
jgi:hypothetical protein